MSEKKPHLIMYLNKRLKSNSSYNKNDLDETKSMLSIMCEIPKLTQVLTELWVSFSCLFLLYAITGWNYF